MGLVTVKPGDEQKPLLLDQLGKKKSSELKFSFLLFSINFEELVFILLISLHWVTLKHEL